MVDYITLLHELPESLRNQVVSCVGSTHDLSLVQILSRFRGQADRLAAEKRSQHRGYRDTNGIFGDGPLVKAEMDALSAMVDGQPGNNSSLSANLRDRYVGESIPYLIRFSEVLVGLQAHAVQAEDAVWQQARRQAEEAAQLDTQRQAQRGAFLKIVPPVQQAAVEKLLQQAKAESAAIEQTGIILGKKGKEILWLPGPPAASELEKALGQLNEDVDNAIAGFIAAMDFDAGVTASEAFNAMLYALNLSSADIPAFSR